MRGPFCTAAATSEHQERRSGKKSRKAADGPTPIPIKTNWKSEQATTNTQTIHFLEATTPAAEARERRVVCIVLVRELSFLSVCGGRLDGLKGCVALAPRWEDTEKRATKQEKNTTAAGTEQSFIGRALFSFIPCMLLTLS